MYLSSADVWAIFIFIDAAYLHIHRLSIFFTITWKNNKIHAVLIYPSHNITPNHEKGLVVVSVFVHPLSSDSFSPSYTVSMGTTPSPSISYLDWIRHLAHDDTSAMPLAIPLTMMRKNIISNANMYKLIRCLVYIYPCRWFSRFPTLWINFHSDMHLCYQIIQYKLLKWRIMSLAIAIRKAWMNNKQGTEILEGHFIVWSIVLHEWHAPR